MFLEFFFVFIIIERLVELYIAKKNSIYIESIGGIEVGKGHYPIIVLLHISFLVSFFYEGQLREQPSYWLLIFLLFVIVQGARFWIIYSLGRFWNTRIYVLPNSKPIKKGPYQYIKHPNYLVVMLEMLLIPLIFGAYFTAVIFPLFNLFILRIRIREEEKALANHTDYEMEMANLSRFIPKK